MNKTKGLHATTGRHEIIAGQDPFGEAPALGPRFLSYARISTGGIAKLLG